jgi:threonine dehydratase
LIDVGDIEAAAERLSEIRVHTPLLQNCELDRIAGGDVLIKPECLQLTGSFKIRGAYNRLSQLSSRSAARGVVAWSSGNHAQGVAAAGSMLGIVTTIVMPQDAPLAKLDNTRRLGGDVVRYDRYSENRESIATAIAAQRGCELVPSYDHEHIIAGQGTIGLEIAEDAIAMGLPPQQVLIPCGGGGLTSGCAVALQSRLPDVNIIAVEPVEFDDTARSFAAGERMRNDNNARSICDALQTPTPGELTFAINLQRLRSVLTVSDAEVRAAMRFAFRELKLVVEPGGAVALAALLYGKVESANRTTVIVLSGGNVDVALFAEIQAEPS